MAQLEQGWIYAIAHVRGGAERGSDWSRSVLKQGKKKTFTDFITCAEHLIAHGYTRKQRIVAHGFSAGGLLMGAIYTTPIRSAPRLKRPRSWRSPSGRRTGNGKCAAALGNVLRGLPFWCRPDI